MSTIWHDPYPYTTLAEEWSPPGAHQF